MDYENFISTNQIENSVEKRTNERLRFHCNCIDGSAAAPSMEGHTMRP